MLTPFFPRFPFTVIRRLFNHIFQASFDAPPSYTYTYIRTYIRGLRMHTLHNKMPLQSVIIMMNIHCQQRWKDIVFFLNACRRCSLYAMNNIEGYYEANQGFRMFVRHTYGGGFSSNFNFFHFPQGLNAMNAV